jgi:CubicO group peptidase (beta-lactamase class C family)
VTPLAALLDHTLTEGAGTAAQAAVATPSGVVLSSARGRLYPGGPAITDDTSFDVASVTKVLATTALCMVLADAGELNLDHPIGRVLPEPTWRDRTWRMLLGHRGGLPAWGPWFEAARRHPHSAGLYPDCEGGMDRRAAADATLAAALGSPAASGPGPRVYSDLGFVALGVALERLAGERLELLAMRHVFAPLRLAATFRRLSTTRPQVPAPVTGILRPREPAPGQEDAYRVHPQRPHLAPGEVDDDNAWALDGVAGHAGLFATALDLARFGAALLADLEGAGRLVRPETVADFLEADAPDAAPVRSLGFDRPATEGSSLGSRFGRGPKGAVGHLGFTGCSLWIDLDRRTSVALVTNRTFPSRGNASAIRRLRPAFHDAVAQIVEGG